MVELSLASGRGPLSVAWIAKHQDLSVAYLEQLLHRLKKRGLVTSVRGPKGGYLLAKDPERITIAEIVRILDGDGMFANGGPNDKGKDHRVPVASAKGQAGRYAQRIAHAVFRCVHERLANALGQVTLQDLCDEVREDAEEPLEHRYVFHI